MNILDKILRLREEKGWSEYKLSVESGIPQSTISSWFCKNAQPSLNSLQAICNACGITMAQFFADDETQAAYCSQMQCRLLAGFSHLNTEQQEMLVQFLESFHPNA